MSKLNMTQVRSMINSAKQATQTKWVNEGGMNLYVFEEDRTSMIASMRGIGSERTDKEMAANAIHIANTCPSTIIPLLEELLELRIWRHLSINRDDGLVMSATTLEVK